MKAREASAEAFVHPCVSLPSALSAEFCRADGWHVELLKGPPMKRLMAAALALLVSGAMVWAQQQNMPATQPKAATPAKPATPATPAKPATPAPAASQTTTAPASSEKSAEAKAQHGKKHAKKHAKKQKMSEEQPK